LLRSLGLAIVPLMADHDRLTPADPADLAGALAYALRYQGRKRVHNADETMAEIIAKRLVEHLERAGFVVMQRAPIGGGAALGRGFEGRNLWLRCTSLSRVGPSCRVSVFAEPCSCRRTA
jgi:hypothetical protein